MPAADWIRRSPGRHWSGCNSPLISSDRLTNRAPLSQNRNGIGLQLLSLWPKEDRIGLVLSWPEGVPY